MLSPPILDTKRLASELYAITEVAKTLTAPFELPELLSAVLTTITQVLEPTDLGAIMMWDQSAGLFRAEASVGYNQEELKTIGLREGESITGKVYDAGHACLMANYEEVAKAMADMREANRQAFRKAKMTDCEIQACLAAPLSVGDQKYGILILETFQAPDGFTEKDLPFIQTLADLIALAIDRARLQVRADAVREARYADRLRAEVMANLSHQLRLPLSSIKGYTTALLLEEVDWPEEKQQEFLEYIEEECDNMQVMLTNMLDSSLIDVGQLSMEKQPLRLQHLAHEVAAEMQRRTEKHRIFVDIPVDFPIVEADPRWIKQVFRNILDNAINYSPEGGLVVLRGEVRSHSVVFSIADQGLGISPEDLIPLFERYFRAKNAHGVHIAGTGLGLPIARSIVEAHQGRIWAESKLGQGTTLYFSLPIPQPLAGND